MSEVKTIDIKEFRELGYLQEINRQFLHPLGLALSISIDEDGNEQLATVWDYRDDEEGMLFHDDVINTQAFKDKVTYVRAQWDEKAENRKRIHGFIVQGEV